MGSRLLASLDAAIAAAPSPIKADCLRIERAGFLARHGRLDESRHVLASLHMRYDSHPNPTVSAWLSWAEALLGYFHDLGGVAAHDKMKRAYAFGGAVRDDPLQAMMAAWLALMDFTQRDFDSMAKHVADAMQRASSGHHAAQARLCLVIADAYHFADRFDLAQPWYVQCRHHANAEGDETTLSAVMHNLAWLQVSHARRAALCGGKWKSLQQQALLSVESAANFDSLIGRTALAVLQPMLKAQLWLLDGRHADALNLYDQHLANALSHGLDRMKSSLLADIAWCRLQLGQVGRALEGVKAAEVACETARDLEERAAAHCRLAQIHRQVGDGARADLHESQAQADWQAHARLQRRVLGLFDQVLSYHAVG
jgi:hypothetical protein